MLKADALPVVILAGHILDPRIERYHQQVIRFGRLTEDCGGPIYLKCLNVHSVNRLKNIVLVRESKKDVSWFRIISVTSIWGYEEALRVV